MAAVIDALSVDALKGAVVAYEQVSLYGLIIVGKRPVLYSKIDPATCHSIFIRSALVEQDLGLNESFLAHNQKLIEQVTELEEKARRRDILVDEETLAAFYAEKIPVWANNRVDFSKWWKEAKIKYSKLMKMDL